MSDLAAIIRRLIDLDASTEVIALAIEAYEVGRSMSATVVRMSSDRDDMSFDKDDSRPTKDDTRRARDRLYRRKKRAMAGINRVSAEANDAADTPPDVADKRRLSADNADMRCDLSSSFLSESEKGTSEERKKRSDTRARGTRITDDWQPTEVVADYARSLNVDPVLLRDEFVDYWIAVPGSRGLNLDWQRTFKNRARYVAKRGTNGHTAQQNRGVPATERPKTGDDAILAGMGRIAARIKAKHDAARRERDVAEGSDPADEFDLGPPRT